MNCLVTGGCGFIGTNLIKSLIEEGGNKIRVVDNLCVGSREQLLQVCTFSEPETITENIENDIELFTCSLTDADALIKVCKGIDVIIHLAAMSGVRESVEEPRVWFDSNVIGTFNVFEAARLNSIKRVIAASSGASIGDTTPPIHEELPMHPVSPYGASKSCMEVYASAYYYSYGIESACLRFSNVYGAYSKQKGSLIAKFTKKILKDEEIHIYGDGEQTRDFIFVDDLIDAIKCCVHVDNLGGEVFQISRGEEHSVNMMTEKIANHFKDRNIMIKHIDPKIGDIKTNWADNTKAKTKLGWNPTMDIDTGISITIDWFLNNYKD